MKKLNLRTVRLWIVPVAIAAIGIYYLWKNVDFSVLARLEGRIVVLLLALTLADSLFSLACQYALLRCSGVQVSPLTAFLIIMASMSANYASPFKLGIPLRVYLYRRLLGVPISRGAALVAIEMFLGLFWSILIAAIGIEVLFTKTGIRVAVIGLGLLFVFVFSFLLINPHRAVLWEGMPFRKKAERLADLLVDFRRGVSAVHWSLLLTVSAVMGLAYVNVAFRVLCIVRALGSEAHLVPVFFAQRVAFVAGSLSMVPMGLGVRDASLTLLLVELGVAKNTAVLAAVIERLLSTGWRILMGVVSGSVLGVRLLTSGAEEGNPGLAQRRGDAPGHDDLPTESADKGNP